MAPPRGLGFGDEPSDRICIISSMRSSNGDPAHGLAEFTMAHLGTAGVLARDHLPAAERRRIRGSGLVLTVPKRDGCFVDVVEGSSA